MTDIGTALDPSNLRRVFRKVSREAGIEGSQQAFCNPLPYLFPNFCAEI